MKFDLRIQLVSILREGISFNPSKVPLNSGVAVLSLSEFTDCIVVAAKDSVSKGCVPDVTLELEITT